MKNPKFDSTSELVLDVRSRGFVPHRTIHMIR